MAQTSTNDQTVRTTRARIIYLRNDYKDLMNVIEKHIHEHFAMRAESGATDEPMTNGTPSNSATVSSSMPASSLPLGPAFAKVNNVVEGSPADSAGLKAGDEIRNFGYVNNTNHDGLKRVGECVQGNEGVSSSLGISKHQLISTARCSGENFSTCQRTQTRVTVNSQATTGLGGARTARLSYPTIMSSFQYFSCVGAHAAGTTVVLSKPAKPPTVVPKQYHKPGGSITIPWPSLPIKLVWSFNKHRCSTDFSQI